MEEVVCDFKKFELYPVEKKEPLKMCIHTDRLKNGRWYWLKQDGRWGSHL